MKFNFFVISLAVVSFLANCNAADQDDKNVEESTKPPTADQMPVTEIQMKTSTDTSPSSIPTETSNRTNEQQQSPELTVADFIIHPLIALKARAPVDTNGVGKQATSSSPWTIFGFNPGQSFGSLAGSVSGWINRFPGFVDTPVHAAAPISTPRPEGSADNAQGPNRKRPNQLDYNEDEELGDYDNSDDAEYDEDDVVEEIVFPAPNRIRPNFANQNNFQDDNDEETYDDIEDEDEDNDFVPAIVQRPNNRIRLAQNNQNLAQQQNRQLFNIQRQRLQQANRFLYNDGDEDDLNENFYGGYPAMKRSQNEIGLFQRGRQNLMRQFPQLKLRRGQTVRRPQQAIKQRRNQANFHRPAVVPLVAKGGSKFSVLKTQAVVPQQFAVKKRFQANVFKQSQKQLNPQSQPLSVQPVPIQNNQPTQYIAIPWSQLSLAPTRAIHSFGIQNFDSGSQLKPIILNIPQSVIDQIRQANQKKHLLQTDEAQPSTEPTVVATTAQPVLPSIKNTPPRRVRPGTMVAKPPAKASNVNKTKKSDNKSADSEVSNNKNNRVPHPDEEYIVVGEDDEPGLVRQVKPVLGNERLLQGGISPFYELLSHQQKSGRVLEEIVEAAANQEEIQQKIPVEIIYDDKIPEPQSTQDLKTESIA